MGRKLDGWADTGRLCGRAQGASRLVLGWRGTTAINAFSERARVAGFGLRQKEPIVQGVRGKGKGGGRGEGVGEEKGPGWAADWGSAGLETQVGGKTIAWATARCWVPSSIFLVCLSHGPFQPSLVPSHRDIGYTQPGRWRGGEARCILGQWPALTQPGERIE